MVDKVMTEDAEEISIGSESLIHFAAQIMERH